MAYVGVQEGNQYLMEGHPVSRKHQYLFRGSLFSWITSPENPEKIHVFMEDNIVS